MTIITCPDCKVEISGEAVSCINCGYKLTAQEMHNNRSKESEQQKKENILFDKIPDLKWHPWIGESFIKQDSENRLLIIGESQYYKAESEEECQLKNKNYENPNCTIQTVKNRGWNCPTWKNIPKTLFLTEDINHQEFWQNTAFYNFIQRPMNYSKKERPNASDFKLGWKVFIDLLDVIQPTHCLFLGVESFKYFHKQMEKMSVEKEGPERAKKINSTYPRNASIKVGIGEVPLIAIKHPGKFYTPKLWNQYLMSHSCGIGQFFDIEKYKKA